MKRTVKQLPLIHRVFAVEILSDRAAGDQAADPREGIGQGRRYDMSISSEMPASQWYWELGLVKETLSHKKSAILLDRLKQAGPLLWNHDRNDQIGRLYNVEVRDGRLVAQIEFSRTQRGMDFELDALTGIKNSVSVGYRVLEMKLTRRGDVEKGEIDEYLVTKWEPFESSIVSIPADISVGVGRQEAEEYARRSGGTLFPAEIEDGDAVREERNMKTKEELEAEAAAAAEAASRVATLPAPAPSPVVEVKPTVNRNAEVVEINAMCRANGIADEKRDSFIGAGLNPQAVAYEIQKIRATAATAQPAAERKAAVETRELEDYSLRRAILMSLPPNEGGIPWGGLEAEVHAEIERKLPIEARRPEGIRGVLIPTNMPAHDTRAAARAARELGRAYPLDSATSTEGTEFKFTGAGEFIDMLRSRLITAKLGARFMPGLPGPIGFPRKTGASTAAWQNGEAAAVSDSMAAFELMTLTPKTLIDTTGTTRQLLRMASEDFEALLRDDILKTHQVAIDTAAFVGTGAAGQPSGLYVLSGIQSFDIGPGANANEAPTYIDITSMIGLLGDASADEGAVAWALTPLLAASLMRTLTFPSANTGEAVFKTTGPGEGLMGGYRALTSNVLSKTLNNGVPTGGAEHGIVLGNYNELFIGEFGAFEIIADPYSSKKSGIIELTSFQMVDVNVRHQLSFVKGVNAIP